LYNAAASYDIGCGHAVNLPPFHFLEEAAHNKRLGIVAIIVQRRRYRHENEARRSLYACPENGLKMRTLLLARDDAHFDSPEAAFFQKLMQLHFAKSEPVVGIQVARSEEHTSELQSPYDLVCRL